MKILLLAGSPSPSSRSARLLHHLGDSLALLGHDLLRLQIAGLPAHALLHAEIAHPSLRNAREQVDEADALVIATPVYKAAYSGVLKVFLDLLPQDGLAGKLVLPLATGGSQSHMLALDYALRPVLSALSARHILPSIYATDAQVTWSPEHGLSLDPALKQRLARGVDNLVAGLNALHDAAVEFAPVDFSSVRCSV